MNPPHFLDTNVLVYSISDDPREARKRERAEVLLSDRNGALSIQILQEFYVQATRATRPDRTTHENAVNLIKAWTRFKVQEMTFAVLDAALEIKAAYGFSYWDSAIIAAARALGCATLYTEDMAHGRQIEGVVIVNPFR